jgi:hypothetical protein
MKISEVSPETLVRLRKWRWDRIIEKHEGPESWDAEFRYSDPEFMMVGGRPVLLPVESERHPNITVLRAIPSADGRTLTLFLRDRTYVTDPEHEMFYAGFLAVCEQFPGEEFYVATVYHEWFIIDNGVEADGVS